MEVKYANLFQEVDLSEKRIPIMIERGKEEGPVIWLCAGIHGDEVSGIKVIHRMFNYLKRNPLKKGTLYAFPLVNTVGFETGMRENPYDGEDINRNFPGDVNGTTTERLAAVVYNSIIETKPSLVIDLHADSEKSIPYSIIDRPVNNKTDVRGTVEKSWEYAEKFGVTVAYDMETEGYKKYGLDKTLTGAMVNRNQIPSFLVELGGPRNINEKFVRIGTSGLKNILSHFDMIDEKSESPWVVPGKIETEHHLELFENVTSNTSGIIEYEVEPGQFVEKGKVLARITNVLGKEEEMIVAENDCYIISICDFSIAFPGNTLLVHAMPRIKPI